MDINANVMQSQMPLIIFLDTFEKLRFQGLEQEKWLNGKYGLIKNTKKVLWFIIGRDRIKWDDNPAWTQIINYIKLNNLSQNEVVNLLNVSGILDYDLVEYIFLITHGTPIYLSLCIEHYKQICDGKIVIKSDFGKNVNELASIYMRYLDDTKKDILFMLSCVSYWNEQLIKTIIEQIPNFSFTAYESIKELSFIDHAVDYDFLHHTVREAVYKYCPSLISERFKFEVNRYYQQSFTKWNPNSSPYGQLVFHYTLYKTTNIEQAHELILCLNGEIYKLFEPLLKETLYALPWLKQAILYV